MTYLLRHAFIAIVGALVLGSVVLGCSGGASTSGVPSAAGTSGEGQPAFVDLQVSSFFLTIENRAAQPLLDVQISIKPAGGLLLYTTTIPKMESSEKRELSLGEFRGRDGSPFDRRRLRPREITVSAVDLAGKKYEITTPWES